MHSISRLAMLCLAGVAAFAQTPGSSGGSGSGGSGSGGPGTPSPVNPVSLKIPNESAPPGGVAQMKFLNTEPTPISSGRPHGLYDDTVFDDIFGIQLFNASGDLNGVAMRDGAAFSIEFISNGAMQGTDYPVMTIALHVRPTAVPGTQAQFDLDPSSTFDVNYQPDIVKPIAPATVTVGGSISITNVVPGGGWRPAGSIIKVEGLGFQPRTQVQLSNVQTQTVSVVSPTEIDITLAQATDMTGKKIQVVNPDGSQDIYFSYTRGINLGMSNQALLSYAIPVFSSVEHSQATFTSVAPPLPSQFTGLAIQNQNALVANVSVSLFSAGNTRLGSSTIAVPPGYRLMREISELTGVAPSPGSYILVSSDQPIQVFGFLADPVAGTVTPFAAAVAQP